MINPDKRRKLIDGLVIAMGPAKGAAKKKPEASESEDAEMPEEEGGDDIQFAKDAARALGVKDMDDAQAEAFAEAIKGLVG